MALAAETLLTQLLARMPVEFFTKKSLHIVVLSAGTFPSFVAFIKALTQMVPSLVEVTMTIIEPVKFRTDHFIRRPSTQQLLQKNTSPRIAITIFNGLIAEFLQTHSPEKFDIIYFEHADLRTWPIIVSKSTNAFWRTVSLRYSIPLLTTIMRPQSFIIASCLSLHECLQLQGLLRFSFNARPHRIQLGGPQDYFYGGRFCSGISATVPLPAPIAVQNTRVTLLKMSDDDLYRVVWLSCLLWVIKLHWPQMKVEWLMAGLLILLQLLFHHCGKNATVVKVFLLIGLIVI